MCRLARAYDLAMRYASGQLGFTWVSQLKGIQQSTEMTSMAAGIELVGLTKRFHPTGPTPAASRQHRPVGGGRRVLLAAGAVRLRQDDHPAAGRGFRSRPPGRILLDGVDVSGVPPHKRKVNTVFQSYALFPFMTATDNVAFGLKYAGCSKSELKAGRRGARAGRHDLVRRAASVAAVGRAAAAGRARPGRWC